MYPHDNDLDYQENKLPQISILEVQVLVELLVSEETELGVKVDDQFLDASQELVLSIEHIDHMDLLQLVLQRREEGRVRRDRGDQVGPAAVGHGRLAQHGRAGALCIGFLSGYKKDTGTYNVYLNTFQILK